VGPFRDLQSTESAVRDIGPARRAEADVAEEGADLLVSLVARDRSITAPRKAVTLVCLCSFNNRCLPRRSHGAARLTALRENYESRQSC
jgi:hypothetical protein